MVETVWPRRISVFAASLFSYAVGASLLGTSPRFGAGDFAVPGLLVLALLGIDVSDVLAFHPFSRPIVSIIGLLTTAAFLTWPVLTPRSWRAAIGAALLVLLPFLACFAPWSRSVCEGSEGPFVFAVVPISWVAIAMIHGIRRLIGDHTVASGLLLGLTPLAVLVPFVGAALGIGLFLVYWIAVLAFLAVKRVSSAAR